MKSKTLMIACIIGAAGGSAFAVKDITTRTNPDATLNVEARYTVHVGLTAYNAGLTKTTSNVTANLPVFVPGGLMEYSSSGGNSGNAGRMNNGVLTWAADGNFSPNTFGRPGPDYVGYLFNSPVKNINRIDFYNTVQAAIATPATAVGGTFAATPTVQYLDAPAPLGAWHNLNSASFAPAYNSSLTLAVADTTETRFYQISINEPLSNVWGIRLFGATQPTGDTYDSDGWVDTQELIVYGDLDIGEINLSKNLAAQSNGATGFGSVDHASTNGGVNGAGWPVLNDADFASHVDTYDFYRAETEDFFGILWPTPQNRVSAMGVSFDGFGDGGWMDDCVVEPFRIEYTTDGTSWIPVTGLDKGRYPYVFHEMWSVLAQASWLFRFDEVEGATGLRIIGYGNGSADGNGFLGAYEIEVFGKPVPAEGVDFDHDGDLDVDDAAVFGSCLSGPDIPQTSVPCKPADLDHDGDVDMVDYSIFQNCISGAGNHWDPKCGSAQ